MKSKVFNIAFLLVAAVCAAAGQVATIRFTSVPAYGRTDSLRGRVSGADTSQRIAVYIFVEGAGWFTKPTYADSAVRIRSDLTWACSITTGGSDIYATGIAAFLMRPGRMIPVARALADLPPSLDTTAIARVDTSRFGRSLPPPWSDWWVKASLGLVGPGPNMFSDSLDNVFVDPSGRLHLKITNRGGFWWCAEVVSKTKRGFGKYEFQIAGRLDTLDRNAVAGMFVWDNASAQDHREIDIEFSRWRVSTNPNAQYVIRPLGAIQRHRWTIGALDSSIHFFEWQTNRVHFVSLALNGDTLHHWEHAGDTVPTSGNERARINLWLDSSQAPSNGLSVEVIIKRFSFIPIITSIAPVTSIVPTDFGLSQNYPNPFNPTTKINFSLRVASFTTLKVYDIVGREVATLVNEELTPGNYEATLEGKDLSSGVYFYRLSARQTDGAQAGSFVQTKKLVLVR